MLLDESRHVISMFEDDVVLVHKQKMPPPAACGSATDISSINYKPRPELDFLSLSCYLQEGEGRGVKADKAWGRSELRFIQSTLTPWR